LSQLRHFPRNFEGVSSGT